MRSSLYSTFPAMSPSDVVQKDAEPPVLSPVLSKKASITDTSGSSARGGSRVV